MSDSRWHLDLKRRLIECRRCPRLVAYRERIAQTKVKRFRSNDYWGRPVPSFGNADARLLVIGLAPAAHGGNRTGRMFTGDRSGDWLYEALYRAGFAGQPTSTHADDGLTLRDCYITSAVHCAPPANKPLGEEFTACLPYLLEELQRLEYLRAIVVLGRSAFNAFLNARQALGLPVPSPALAFGHARCHDIDGLTLVCSYHPSQQNTFTGRLTREMFHQVFQCVRAALDTAPAIEKKAGPSPAKHTRRDA
ncbi:MAG: uracil-DNA glycosylase [Gammaproteobacteria bacterium]